MYHVMPCHIMPCHLLIGGRFYWGGVCKEIVDGLFFLQPIILSWLVTHISNSQINRENPPAEWLVIYYIMLYQVVVHMGM